MKKMQVIQILVIFSVFLVQCYSSVDAVRTHIGVKDEDLQISLNEKKVSITVKNLFEDIIKDNSLFEEIPDKINVETNVKTKGEISKLYILEALDVSLSASYDESGNIFTVTTPQIIVDILGRKIECPKIDNFANLSENNALDLKLVVDFRIDGVFDVFEEKIFTESVPYYANVTSDNKLFVNFSFEPFKINPFEIRGQKLEDGTKKDKVNATITTYIKSTVKPNVFANANANEGKITEVMSCKHRFGVAKCF